jgi:hypothetical protein
MKTMNLTGWTPGFSGFKLRLTNMRRLTMMLPRTALMLALFIGVSLAACDAPAEQTSATGQVVEPAAGEAKPISGDLSEGSMAEDSPAGEAVTEQEIPHSDVPPPSREAFKDASCDFEGWVGKPVDEAAVKETGRVYRILKPDSMMTMDHNPERINVVHGEDGKVTRVWCG